MPQHVVVDGSNIATEGRSLPSLAQLNEAVMAFMAEYPEALITVVVDATFGHRIDPKETAEFDEAIANNELVAPPAGAVGRGDAFVLSIAKKVNATILTNDSYQEFHGQVDWLFDEGRLIGGKPVPHVGWVFVPRLPVRGAVSRSAVKDAKRKRGGSTKAPATVRQGSAAANQPMPVPKTPPPTAKPTVSAADVAKAEVSSAPAEVVAAASVTPKAVAVNDFLPFLAFVEHHPVGSSVNAVVENYSSHGAYVRVGDVKGYVPLRLMADPAPRSAREFMKIGDAVTLVVESFAPARRSIDLAVAGMSTAKLVEPPPVKASRSRKKAAAPAASEAPVERETERGLAGAHQDHGSSDEGHQGDKGHQGSGRDDGHQGHQGDQGSRNSSRDEGDQGKWTGCGQARVAGTRARTDGRARCRRVSIGRDRGDQASAAHHQEGRRVNGHAVNGHAVRPTPSSGAEQPAKAAARQPAKRAAKKTSASGAQPTKRATSKSAAAAATDTGGPAGAVDDASNAATSTDATPARRRRRVH